MTKVTVLGYRKGPQPSATEMVEQELMRARCQLVDDNPDLLVELCGTYEMAEEFYKTKCNKNCVRLYNLLDVNNSNPNFYQQAAIDYENCEIATTISQTVDRKSVV